MKSVILWPDDCSYRHVSTRASQRIRCLATTAIYTPELTCTWAFKEPQALTKLVLFPQHYFSSPHSPGASPGEGTTGMNGISGCSTPAHRFQQLQMLPQP